MRLRDDHAFEQRKATVVAILDSLGDLTVFDSGRAAAERAIGLELDAPPRPLVSLGRFRYREVFDRDGAGWTLASYAYDYLDLEHGGRYLDLEHGGRLAYHWHPLPGRPAVHHLHCRPPVGRPSVSHFRAYDVDLLEAHDEFVRLFATGSPIDCTGLRPLRAAS